VGGRGPSNAGGKGGHVRSGRQWRASSDFNWKRTMRTAGEKGADRQADGLRKGGKFHAAGERDSETAKKNRNDAFGETGLTQKGGR